MGVFAVAPLGTPSRGSQGSESPEVRRWKVDRDGPAGESFSSHLDPRPLPQPPNGMVREVSAVAPVS